MFGVPSLVYSCGSLATPLCIAGVLPKPKIGLFTGFLSKRQEMAPLPTALVAAQAKQLGFIKDWDG